MMRKNHHVSTISRMLCVALLFALLTSPIAADAATARTATKHKATPRRSQAWKAKTTSPATQSSPGGITPSTTDSPAGEADSSQLAQAKAILQLYVARYPILAGTTVRIENAGDTYNAMTFVASAEIVINSSHTATLDQIIGHEIWHVIDWRDNQRIDWGERVPPANY